MSLWCDIMLNLYKVCGRNAHIICAILNVSFHGLDLHTDAASTSTNPLLLNWKHQHYSNHIHADDFKAHQNLKCKIEDCRWIFKWSGWAKKKKGCFRHQIINFWGPVTMQTWNFNAVLDVAFCGTEFVLRTCLQGIFLKINHPINLTQNVLKFCL